MSTGHEGGAGEDQGVGQKDQDSRGFTDTLTSHRAQGFHVRTGQAGSQSSRSVPSGTFPLRHGVAPVQDASLSACLSFHVPPSLSLSMSRCWGVCV